MEHQDALAVSVVITAAGRVGEDLARLLETDEKCAVLWHGKPLVYFASIAALGVTSDVVIVCSDHLKALLSNYVPELKFAEPGSNPVSSAANGVDRLDDSSRIIFLPGDLPLVKPEHVLDFARRLPSGSEPWLAAGLTSEQQLVGKFGQIPGLRTMTLDGIKYAGGGLFAASNGGFQRAVDLVSQMSSNRKSQFRMAMRFGPISALRYFTGFMATSQAEAAAGRLFECKSQVITGCAPETVMDVDEIEDWTFLVNWDNAQRTAAASSST